MSDWTPTGKNNIVISISDNLYAEVWLYSGTSSLFHMLNLKARGRETSSRNLYGADFSDTCMTLIGSETA